MGACVDHAYDQYGGDRMIEIKLPFWLSNAVFEGLRKAAVAYWGKIEEWITWPLTQFDALTCSEAILDLLAYQRDITQFTDEPLDMYRKRVALAYVNACDAGSKAGFEAIFARLGIGYLETEERSDPVDWDVVLLRLSDSQVAQNPDLLQRIIQKYGRTCRRYQLQVITPIVLGVEVRAVGHQYDYAVARQVMAPWVADVGADSRALGHSWSVDVAAL